MTDTARPLHHRRATPVHRRTHAARPASPKLTEVDAQMLVTFAALSVGQSHHDVHCGLSLVRSARAPETVAATDEIPVRADWLQHQLRQGPTVSPLGPPVVVSRDLAADVRWPDFGRQCAAVLDLRSAVMLRIPLTGDEWAILAFYCSEPETLDHLDIQAATHLVPLAAATVKELAQAFRGAIDATSAADVGRVALACGVLIERQQVAPAEAFCRLLEASRDRRRPLLQIALEVISRGDLDPAPGSAATNRPVRVGGPDTWRDWSRTAWPE